MTVAIVAASMAAGWAVSIAALVRLLANVQRAHARREDTLVNQLLHAAGKTWQPAPVSADRDEPAAGPPEWTWAPEQQPVY